MRVLVLHAHPVETSYNAALHRMIVDRLQANGHDVDDCDLYAESFEPRLSRTERLAYHDVGPNLAPVAEYVERLRAAEGLVMCYPVWNFGYPAILKGYFDRVFLPGVSFDIADGTVTTGLLRIRKVTAVTTYGASHINAFIAGDPPRKAVMRVLRGVIGWRARFSYLAHYDMNRSTDITRTHFKAKVEAAMNRF